MYQISKTFACRTEDLWNWRNCYRSDIELCEIFEIHTWSQNQQTRVNRNWNDSLNIKYKPSVFLQLNFSRREIQSFLHNIFIFISLSLRHWWKKNARNKKDPKSQSVVFSHSQSSLSRDKMLQLCHIFFCCRICRLSLAASHDIARRLLWHFPRKQTNNNHGIIVV